MDFTSRSLVVHCWRDIVSEASSTRSQRRSGWRAAYGWIFLGSLATGTCALALQMPIQVGMIRSETPPTEESVRASIDFDTARTVLSEENLRLIAAIANAAKTSPLPVAVAPFAAPSGSRDQNLGLARKRAAGVREALVTMGVPRVRVVILSPTFAENGSQRVEVSLVRGVRVFQATTS